jgi:hypothetical protein
MDYEYTFARPAVEQFVQGGFPSDRLVRLLESGELEEYPLNGPIYS